MNDTVMNFPKMEYPGRFIVLGKNEGKLFAVYGVTARNPSSRAKRYVYDKAKDVVVVESTDQEVMAQGNLDLLQYTAMRFFPNGMIVGNGQQTDLFAGLKSNSAAEELKQTLRNESYEPDKYNTPRITGCFLWSDDIFSTALSSIQSDENGKVVQKTWDILLKNGEGKFLSTYAGPNVRPTPSFVGEPIKLLFEECSANDLLKSIYSQLKPSLGSEDLRVSVVVAVMNDQNFEKEIFVINSCDL
jgi:IMP cyclohydrolase